MTYLLITKIKMNTAKNTQYVLREISTKEIIDTFSTKKEAEKHLKEFLMDSDDPLRDGSDYEIVSAEYLEEEEVSAVYNEAKDKYVDGVIEDLKEYVTFDSEDNSNKPHFNEIGTRKNIEKQIIKNEAFECEFEINGEIYNF